MEITLPDGSKRTLDEGATVYDLAASIGAGLARDAVAGKVDGMLVDLSTELTDGATVEIVTTKSPEALEIMRHSAAHIMAEAVQALYPDVLIAFGPATEDGFFYDFELPHSISENDFEAIEAKMAEIIAANEPFVREVVSREQAKKIFADQRFKVEHIDDLAPDAEISVYRHGNFVDLCAGPHIANTSQIGAFKLMKIAGAYWKGDSEREMLQRLYGTAFFKKKELATHLHNLAEAEKRDHRKVGKELGYFMLDEDAGVGLPLYPPKGARVIRLLQEWLRRDLYERGYEEVITPHVYKSDVWKTSGHYDFYGENMYFFNINEGSEENPRLSEYGVKPMNCPGHVLIYRNEIRSYRDLPLRLFEFGTVYRHELSGAVHGLLRARGFTQDDAHVFCTKDQVVSEVVAILDLVDHIMSTFGFEYMAEISTRPEKSIGSDEMWEHATNSLMEACKQHNLDYEINEGDGAFYGPKIDFHLEKAPEHAGDAVLTLENVTLKSERNPNKNILNQVSFSVHKGEILCVAGIEGNGQSELVRVIVGLLKQNSGKILLNGEDVSHAPIRYRNVHGLAHVPEDRHKYGLILDNTLEENLAMRKYFRKEFQNHGFIRFHKRHELAEELIEEFDIRSSEGAKSTARSMSGGNQQKAIIAREIDSDENVILAMQPTRGLDVGAIENIHKNLLRQRDAGKAVLLVSFDLEEVMNISDRIIVFYEGEIVADVRPEEVTVNELGLYMSGSKRKGAVK